MTDSTPTQWTILNDAHVALRAAVRGVGADDWTRPTPCADWNVTQVLQHAAGDQIGYASFLTGGPGPSENPFAPSGSLNAAPETVVDEATQAAADAWATISDGTLEVAVPIPPNKMPAALGVGACALDAAVHAWDIALATGQPSPLTPEMSRELLEVARQIVEPIRAFAFAPALETQDGDDATAELLRYLGRRPDWTA